MNPITIQTHNLTRDFKQLRAVDGLTIEVPQSAIFGLLGPNGAGKTTTILLLLGLLEPTVGHAKALGFDCHTQANDIRHRAGVLFEHSGLYERLSAEENLDFFGRIWHISAPERRSRVKDLLYHFDLWDRRKEIVRTLSRGMRRKLAIARVLFHRPNLIFLDEPTSGLDPVASAALREDLRNLTESEGITVFLTTHNLAEAEQICTQVGIIRQGKLLATGPPKDITNEGIALKVVIIGSNFGDKIPTLLGMHDEVVSVKVNENQLIVELNKNIEIAPLVNLIVNEGAQVEEIHKNRTSLEDAFLKLMAEENDYRHMDNN
jgi:ABC-2 type transport system ATP-binding protein